MPTYKYLVTIQATVHIEAKNEDLADIEIGLVGDFEHGPIWWVDNVAVNEGPIKISDDPDLSESEEIEEEDDDE